MQQNQQEDMRLVLSSDAKPRLKWTPELHQRFADAVSQLGGPDKATPKSLMRVMSIPGLTLYHLKSHLQKYRLGISQQPEDDIKATSLDSDYRENQSREAHFSVDINHGTKNPMNESVQIAEALQMHMEVQRKLHEQIEVQRHLQLRIEAQGKYLQTVLKKAQETLSAYNSSSVVGVESAKAELSHLVSQINNGSSLSELTEITEERMKKHSTPSSLESSISDGTCGRKRSGSTISDGNWCENEPYNNGKKSRGTQKEKSGELRKLGCFGGFDLNRSSQCGNDYYDSGE